MKRMKKMVLNVCGSRSGGRMPNSIRQVDSVQMKEIKMQWRRLSYLLVFGGAVVVLVSLVVLAWRVRSPQAFQADKARVVVQAQRSAGQAEPALTMPSAPQVMVGTPEEYQRNVPTPRYTYRNEFPADRSQPLPLYVIDTQTGQEIRLGNDSGAGVYGTQDDKYLLWHFLCGAACREFQQGLYAYTFATQENRLVSTMSIPGIFPKLVGEWVAFGRYDPRDSVATLFAANLQTHEVLTLTHELNAQDGGLNGYFGISPQLAAWYTVPYPDPPQLVIYDLTTRTEITRLTDFSAVFNQQVIRIYALSPGETVVTWSRNYGFDLVTNSYFRIEAIRPSNWDGQLSSSVSSITETNRILYWSFQMQDGTQRYVRAPLLDATPSATPCIEGQNLIQNGDLEETALHALWQQRGNQSNLLVDDPPPGAPNGGQWAIRLGRYRNAQQEIRQLLELPSGVKTLDLHFDLHVGTWDVWGSDRLEVDFIHPATGQSLLTTSVRWNSRQLPTGRWLPLEVQVQGWPGIDTSVYLALRGITDWAIPTDFTLDNIRLTTLCQ
jgi:hypothetical protein